MARDNRLKVNIQPFASVPLGRFTLSCPEKEMPQLIVRPQDQTGPSTTLWQTIIGEPFLRCATGVFNAAEYQGNFNITDSVSQWSQGQTIESLEVLDHSAVVVRGRLSLSENDRGSSSSPTPLSWPYEVEMREETDRRLCIKARLVGTGGPSGSKEGGRVVTHLRLDYKAPGEEEEGVFGFGVQYTSLDVRGQVVPVWVSEQGVGRGLEPLTTYLNVNYHGTGGTPWTTYAPLPYYVTASGRSLFLKNTEYSVFDLGSSSPGAFRVYVAAAAHAPPVLEACVIRASSLPEAVTEFTSYQGRMDPLPGWVSNGVVVGLQGGTDVVLSRLASLDAAGVPVAALWLQDWSGKRTDPFGERVLWNWEVDLDRYPGWPALLSNLSSRGIKVLSYVNPYLATNVTTYRPNVRRDLYEEARALGYLVKRADGQPYVQASGSEAFRFGTVDLTNPSAVQWYEEVIACHMLCVCRSQAQQQGRGEGHHRHTSEEEEEEEEEEALVCGQGGPGVGVRGGMLDFGEYLPADAVLWSDQAGERVHNDFPRLWAQVGREAVAGTGRDDDTVFFMRSGFLGSSAWSRLYWLGDQLVTWDGFDGLASALTGLLSSGLSGMALSHSDLGGYTSLDVDIGDDSGGHTRYSYNRSKELLLRWMEMSAFSDAMFRSHEGNRPSSSWQVYSDDDTLAHLSRFSTIFSSLGPYRHRLMEQAQSLGWPLVRPTFWHHPQDPEAWRLHSSSSSSSSQQQQQQQFLLGPDLIMAPVLLPNTNSVDIYLPRGTWESLWNCTPVIHSQGQWLRSWPAPLGYPAVFTSQGSDVSTELRARLPPPPPAAAYLMKESAACGHRGGRRHGGTSHNAPLEQSHPPLLLTSSTLPPWPILVWHPGLLLLLTPFIVVTLRTLLWLSCLVPRLRRKRRGGRLPPPHDQQHGHAALYTSLEMSGQRRQTWASAADLQEEGSVPYYAAAHQYHGYHDNTPPQ